MFQKIKEGIDIRLGLSGLLHDTLEEYKVPSDTNIFYTIGIMTLVAYMIQAVTGYFLLIYYIPHSDHAFNSIQGIMTTIPFGWLIRMVHIVVSNLMIALVMIHLISIFLMGSYKKPREMTWLAGGLLLIIALAFSLSGYLLPWSQRSYWATTIVTNIPTAFPVVGDFLATILKGGESVSGVTLTRFFALHVGFLPPLFMLIMGIHIFLVWRIGLSVPSASKSAAYEMPWTEYGRVTYSKSYPFYPNFVRKQTSMIMLFLAVTFLIIAFMPTLFLPETATTPADPLKTPPHIKPEWYFLAPYQMLKLITNKFLGICIQIMLLGLILFWPFLDRNPERNILKRPMLLLASLALLGIWLVFTFWGKYS